MVQGRAGCSRQSLVQGPLEPAWQHAGSLHLPDHEHETHLRHYRRLVGRDVLGAGCRVEGGHVFLLLQSLHRWFDSIAVLPVLDASVSVSV